MKTEMGEYIAGAYLKIIEKCDVVDYNVRPPGGGFKGLGEIDVIGLSFDRKAAFICEVTTHILGLRYGSNPESVKRVKDKFLRQQEYARDHLKSFRKRYFMFWSPYVPRGYLTDHLSRIKGLQLVINEEYASRVDRLMSEAAIITGDVGNPFFRALQILNRLRRYKIKEAYY